MTTSRLFSLWPVFLRRGRGMAILFFPGSAKRKGLQLALEPLDGQGIAGYVPEP